MGNGFQQTVNIENAFGIQGALYDDGPVRSAPYNLVSASAAYNIIGATAFTVTSADPGDNSGSAVAQAGSGGIAFAGILMNPKTAMTSGTSSGALNPTMTLPNNTIGELLTMGDIIVALPGPASVGDFVAYDNTSGLLSTYARKTNFTGALGTAGALTVSALTSGQVQVGQMITGASIPGGVYVTGLGTGVGDTGTYTTNYVGTAITAEAMSADSLPPAAAAFTAQFYTTGVMTVTGISSGEVAVGQVLSGVNVPPGAVVTGYGTGVGGTGGYTVNTFVAGASGAVTADATSKVPNAEVYQFQPTGLVGGVGVIKITS